MFPRSTNAFITLETKNIFWSPLALSLMAPYLTARSVFGRVCYSVITQSLVTGLNFHSTPKIKRFQLGTYRTIKAVAGCQPEDVTSQKRLAKLALLPKFVRSAPSLIRVQVISPDVTKRSLNFLIRSTAPATFLLGSFSDQGPAFLLPVYTIRKCSENSDSRYTTSDTLLDRQK